MRITGKRHRHVGAPEELNGLSEGSKLGRKHRVVYENERREVQLTRDVEALPHFLLRVGLVLDDARICQRILVGDHMELRVDLGTFAELSLLRHDHGDDLLHVYAFLCLPHQTVCINVRFVHGVQLRPDPAPFPQRLRGACAHHRERLRVRHGTSALRCASARRRMIATRWCELE